MGVSAIGGLGLSSLLAAKADATLKHALRDRSVVVLNLQGGPTQFETFDPKMVAPSPDPPSLSDSAADRSTQGRSRMR